MGKELHVRQDHWRSTDYVRLTEDLCQQCWAENNPDEYFPNTPRYGKCAKCGTEGTLVSRSYVLDKCESGWTGDRCVFTLGHEGPHSNEESNRTRHHVND